VSSNRFVTSDLVAFRTAHYMQLNDSSLLVCELDWFCILRWLPAAAAALWMDVHQLVHSQCTCQARLAQS
jgi:hypothetical protein